jgi:2-keto-4-pentenoate hydratase/2-oxohepta-3-ene-1,7-dioic acid hydratase in catechol pathway
MNSVNYENKKVTPSKVVCVGRNYVEHIKELHNEMLSSMVLFNKPNSAISNELKFISNGCRFEGEICFLVKDNKFEAIGFGLDLTKADVQNSLKSKGLPWERAKAFDNSAVFSKFVKLNQDIGTVKMELFLNDELVQLATFDLMIYKPNQILNEIKNFMSLEDGDIIMTGTPKGVANYKLDDKFLAKIYLEENLILEEEFIAK